MTECSITTRPWVQEEFNITCPLIHELCVCVGLNYVNMSVMLLHASFDFNVASSHIQIISIITIPLRFLTSVIFRFPRAVRWILNGLSAFVHDLYTSGSFTPMLHSLSVGISKESGNINIFEICQHGSSGARWRHLFFTESAICLAAGLDVLFCLRCVM